LYLQAESAGDPAVLLQQGRLAEAERSLRSQIARAPQDARALLLLGVVLDNEKKFDEAEAFYRRATKSAPEAAPVWNNFGNHWLARGRPEEACTAFTRVLAIDPNHANAHLQLARISLDQGNAAQAVTHLRAVHAGESSDPALLFLYGRALAAKRE